MVTILPADFNQFLCPIPSIRQDVEFASDRKTKALDQLLRHGNFCLKTAAALGPSRMIQSGPEGHKGVLPKQRRHNPLMAKDIRQIARMVFIPSTSRNFRSSLFLDRIVQDDKERGTSLDAKGFEELMDSHIHNFIHSPRVLPQKTSKAGKRFSQKGSAESFDHGGGMSLFAKLDEADNKRGEELKGRP